MKTDLPTGTAFIYKGIHRIEMKINITKSLIYTEPDELEGILKQALEWVERKWNEVQMLPNINEASTLKNCYYITLHPKQVRKLRDRVNSFTPEDLKTIGLQPSNNCLYYYNVAIQERTELYNKENNEIRTYLFGFGYGVEITQTNIY